MSTKNVLNEAYWSERYQQGNTPWEVGKITPPLKLYIDQLTQKELRILIPGAGNAHEAEYLHKKGFSQVYVLDVSPAPLQAFRQRVPDFPQEHILQQDFFSLTSGQYDLVLEQTFFCALPRELRSQYARKMFEILKPGGRLTGVLFVGELGEPGPPFGGSALEYQAYFEPYFYFRHFGTCLNSIKPRQGRELFMALERRERPQFIA